MGLSGFGTFSTYGERLHGDDRGSCDKDLGRLGSCESLHRAMQENLSQNAFTLTGAQRARMLDYSMQYASEHNFFIDGINFRTNHVHVVYYTEDPELTHERIIGGLKGYLAHRMHREKRIWVGQKIWGRRFGYSNIVNYNSWYHCLNYTLFQQNSNNYMLKAWFVKRLNLPIIYREWEGVILPEPEPNALRRAFAESYVQVKRKMQLGEGGKIEINEIQVEDDADEE